MSRKCKKSFTKEQLEKAVSQSISIRSTLMILGLNPKGGGNYYYIHRVIKEYNLDISHFTGKASNKGKTFKPKRMVNEYLSNEQPITSFRLKNRLLKEGLLTFECAVCKGTTWMNQSIPLELDHINGKHLDNRLENLRLLCPNCHAQTPTHCGKNQMRANKALLGIDTGLAAECSPNLIADSQEISQPEDPVVKTCRKTKIDWPPLEEMAVLVWKEPRSTLAKILGVSDQAIAKHCSKFGISQPPRGYWAILRSRS